MRNITTIGLSLGLFAITITAEAQQRVFVSAVHGDDTANCSAVTPCRSFAHALTVVLPGGEVLALDSGGYGPMSITQSVSVVAPPGIEGSVTQSTAGHDAIDINASGGTVVLRGLSLFGLGGGDAGIVITAATAVFIDSCSATGFTVYGVFEDVTSATLLTMTNSVVAQNANAGLEITGAADDEAIFEVDHCRFLNNARGVECYGSGRGTIRDTVIAGGTWGLNVGATPGKTALVGVEGGSITEASSVGVQVSGGGNPQVRLSNTLIAHNAQGLSAGNVGAHIWSRSNNSIYDNGIDGAATDFFTAQ